jgi:glucose-6-phosphate 1-dehydrogenase
MPQIHPRMVSPDTVCGEISASPCALVLFGASGDLAHRKLIPSLSQLDSRGLLNERFFLVGCARTPLSDTQFRDSFRQAALAAGGPADPLDSLLARFTYLAGDYDRPDLYVALKERLVDLDSRLGPDGTIIYYLAVPPSLYGTITQHLAEAGLARSVQEGKRRPRLVVEKPFGRDLATARELNQTITSCFDESQVYRIDHYLGKETVQNILMLRFANAIFEPIWNRHYIDHVQITIAETAGVEHRGSYYDQAGAIRDMMQNHMLQMLALVAMEPPDAFEADAIRDERVKLLRAIRALEPSNLETCLVRAQYGGAVLSGRPVNAYAEEPGVARGSQTETFVAARLYIDNWRWKDVPFYLRTGKRLGARVTEIAVSFKAVPHSMFACVGLDQIPANTLVLRIQPEEGMSLQLQAKKPGSKICMGTLDMAFSYETLFGVQMPEAYQRLLLDCMLGDQTLYMRFDSVEATWRWLDPAIKACEAGSLPLYVYRAGVSSFAQCDHLIQGEGRQWRDLAAT